MQILVAGRSGTALLRRPGTLLADEVEGSGHALREALVAEPPAVAALDVFDTEPLPSTHPSWAMDNVHVSAHRCADVEGWRDELVARFEDDLRRWTAGEPLHHGVDEEAGYVRSC